MRLFLSDKYIRLEREKISHWLMNFNRGSMNIDGCRGERITTSGGVFDGSAREIYWSFMRPCVEDIIGEALEKADDLGRKYPPSIARRGLDETEALLRTFVARVYKRMVDIDQRLRGNGYPETAGRYDASREIEILEGEIRDRTAALRGLHLSGFPRLRAYFEENPSALLTIGMATLALIVAVASLFVRTR